MGDIPSRPVVRVPDELEELLTPAWLSAALGQRFPGIEVTAVEPGPVIRRVSTNALFRIECAGGVPDGLSAHLVAKGYFGEDARPFRAIGESEAYFYRDLADHTGVRTLRSVWADVDPESRHGVVITEDALVAGGRFLDALSDFTPDQVAESLEQLATLHAATWMRSAHAGERALDPRFDLIAEHRGLDLIEANFEGDLGDRIPPEARNPRRLYETYPAVVAASAQASPWTVIHGDAHVGNLLIDGDGHPGLVDWQLVQRGAWYMDVGYHLAATLPVEERRRHEDDLLRHYLDRLRNDGLDAPTMDEARPAVALGMIHGYYLWAITQFVDPTVIAVLLERLGAAVADHDAFAVASRLDDR
jgi:hypothetical protein